MAVDSLARVLASAALAGGGAGALKFKGSCTFEELPTTGQQQGDVWDVTNDFTLDGKKYPAGTNVAWTGEKWDALGGNVDLSNYLAKDNTTAFTPAGDYNPATKKYVDDNVSIVVLTDMGSTSNPVVLHNNTIYKFANNVNTSDFRFRFEHERAGAWHVLGSSYDNMGMFMPYLNEGTFYQKCYILGFLANGAIMSWEFTRNGTGSGGNITHVRDVGSIVYSSSSSEDPQTIYSKKIFNQLPESSVTPTTDNQFVNKKYVDGMAIQYSVMPTASADNLGQIVQFTGTTTTTYTNGHFYKCVSDGQATATYSWEEITFGGVTPISALVYIEDLQQDSSGYYLIDDSIMPYTLLRPKSLNTGDYKIRIKGTTSQGFTISGHSDYLLVYDITRTTPETSSAPTNFIHLIYRPTWADMGILAYDVYFWKSGTMTFAGSRRYSYNMFVQTSEEQTITGKKTFNVLPESSVVPTTNNQLVNKKYVDDNLPEPDNALNLEYDLATDFEYDEEVKEYTRVNNPDDFPIFTNWIDFNNPLNNKTIILKINYDGGNYGYVRFKLSEYSVDEETNDIVFLAYRLDASNQLTFHMDTMITVAIEDNTVTEIGMDFFESPYINEFGLIGYCGDLANLETAAQDDLVAAINEINGKIGDIDIVLESLTTPPSEIQAQEDLSELVTLGGE